MEQLLMFTHYALYYKRLIVIVALSCATLLASPVQGQEENREASQAEVNTPETSTFEVSIGSGYQFDSSEILKYGDDQDLVPISAVLLLFDWSLNSRFKLSALYNLAVSTDKRIINGVVKERMVPSLALVGLSWTALRFHFKTTSCVELQGSLYGGVVVDDDPIPFPAASFRIHLMQNVKEGVSMYFGGLWAFRVNVMGPLYGVSYRF